MGASGSMTSNIESNAAGSIEEVRIGDCQFLMGKLERLAPAAQKVFSLGKLYLSSQNSETDMRDRNDFNRLFPSTDAGDALFSDNIEEAFKLFRPLKKSAPLHHGQTYVQWKVLHDYQSGYLFCTHRRNVIYIQPIDDFPVFVKNFRFMYKSMSLDLFEMIQGFAQIFFSGMDVVVLPGIYTENLGWEIASRYHQVTGQKQYLVNDFYPKLQSILPSNGVCILGLTWTDLFPENYNFVLGEASLQHRAGIFCFGRYPPSMCNKDQMHDLMEVTGEVIWKLMKVISHEVCHLFGLNHCTYFHCAMNESNSLIEALTQPFFLCPVCLRKLHQVCGFDVLERYTDLLQFLKDIQAQLPCSYVDKAIQWLENCLQFLNS